MNQRSYSIVICTHNRAETLARALATYNSMIVPAGCEFEIVVVDNASTDRTAQVIDDFAASAAFVVKRVHEQRLGHSVALNSGVQAATGEVIVFTDDDAFPMPGWFAEYDRIFTTTDATWALGPVVPRWVDKQPDWYGAETSAMFACLDYGPHEFVVTEPKHYFAGVNHACRRSAIDELGGYREELGLNGTIGGVGNDEDLFRRALAAGYKIVYTPVAGVHHEIGPRRCEKNFHRSYIKSVSEKQFRFLQVEPPATTIVRGLPRYYYRLLLTHVWGWCKCSMQRKPSATFWHEVQVRRFGHLVFIALRRGGTGRAPQAATS